MKTPSWLKPFVDGLPQIEVPATPNPDREERGETWTIYVCSLCGSDEIEEATESDAKCGACGEWMNTEPIRVTRLSDLTALAQERDVEAMKASQHYRSREDFRQRWESEKARAESLQARVEELERRIFDGGRELGRNLRESQARVRELEEGIASVTASIDPHEWPHRELSALLSHQPEDTANERV
jgi:hypothetical protein